MSLFGSIFDGKDKVLQRYMSIIPKADMIYTEDHSGNGINRVFTAIVNPDKNSSIPLVTFNKSGFDHNHPLGSNYVNLYSNDPDFFSKNGLKNNSSAVIEATEFLGKMVDGVFVIRSQKAPFVNFAKDFGVEIDKLNSSLVLDQDCGKFKDYKEFRNKLDEKPIFSVNQAIDSQIKFVLDSLYYGSGKVKFPDAQLSASTNKFIER